MMDVYRNREFCFVNLFYFDFKIPLPTLVHDPLVILKFKFDALSVSEMNLNSKASKSWARTECGILVLIQTHFQPLSNFFVYKMSDITKQMFFTLKL